MSWFDFFSVFRLTVLLHYVIRLVRSKKQGAYGRVPTIKAGTLAQLSHIDEVTSRDEASRCVDNYFTKHLMAEPLSQGLILFR